MDTEAIKQREGYLKTKNHLTISEAEELFRILGYQKKIVVSSDEDQKGNFIREDLIQASRDKY